MAKVLAIGIDVSTPCSNPPLNASMEVPDTFTPQEVYDALVAKCGFDITRILMVRAGEVAALHVYAEYDHEHDFTAKE